MCALAGVSRTGYYRHWRASRPRQEETALRDRIQKLALANRHYGYRRVTALLKREGVPVNHKRVLRIAREDNLLCLRRRRFVPVTTQSGHRFKMSRPSRVIASRSGPIWPVGSRRQPWTSSGWLTSPTSGWMRNSPTWRW
jgi:transposase InsO family protein